MASIRTSVLRDMREAYASCGYLIPRTVDEALERDRDWSEAVHLLSLHEAHGVEAAQAVSRRNTAATKHSGLFASLEKQALHFVGRRPQAMMRFYPGAYSMAMRNAGNAAYADGVSGGRMQFSGMPETLASHAGYRAGLRGALEGLLERLGWCGEVSETHGVQLATSITFTMRWWRPVPSATTP